jgi:hypothetical protein
MKKLIVLIIMMFLFYGNIKADTCFYYKRKNVGFDHDNREFIAITAADIDGDGDEDFIGVVNEYSDWEYNIFWFENDGNANFTQHYLINYYWDNEIEYAQLSVIDLDSDNDMDIILVTDIETVWFENEGGYFSENYLDIYNSDLYPIDIDGDGDVDLLNTYAWYENDGNENFTEHNTVGGTFAIDIDNDNDIDVLNASYGDDKIAWYENDGSENFTEHEISTSADGARSVYALDLDGDGDIDVLSASSNDDKIAWYENDGSENFTEHEISTDFSDARSVYAVDIDGDDDIDVLCSSWYDMAWYENDGSENFTEHMIDDYYYTYTDFSASDFNNDNYIDILICDGSAIDLFESIDHADLLSPNNRSKGLDIETTISWKPTSCIDSFLVEVSYYKDFSSTILSTNTTDTSYTLSSDLLDRSTTYYWRVLSVDYENPGLYSDTWSFTTLLFNPGKNFGSNKYEISTEADGARSVYALDLDGDGDIDVLSASSNDDKIAWYENDGSENFTEHEISTEADGARSVYALDLDGDGDIDVLSASTNDDKIAWYENDGSENFTEHEISTNANGASSVYAIDVDGDGDIDVMSASSYDDKIAWYENDGNEDFTEHEISTEADGASSIYALDLDGDGDIDVMSASSYDDKIAWYENDGSENFTEHEISTNASAAGSVYAIDVDGDEDIDVLSASSYDDKIAWYENDGNNDFIEHVISNTAGGAINVFPIDMDDDGDIDILSASAYDDKITWYENDGSEYFIQKTISTSSDYASCVYAIDLDSDSDLDVLSASAYDDKITWYENELDLISDAGKVVQVTMYMDGQWDGSSHTPIPVSGEIRLGDDLITSTLVKRVSGTIGTNGQVVFDFGNESDGDYWLVVRAGGYLPLGSTSQISLSDSVATYDFTDATSKAAGGERALKESNGIYLVRTGDLNFDRRVSAGDVLYISEPYGKNLRPYVPEP